MAKRKNGRKGSKFFRVFSLLFSILLILITALLIIQLIRLNVLPIFFVLPISIILVTITLLFVIFLVFKSKKGLSRFIFSILVLILSFAYSVGNYYLFETNKAFDSVTNLTTKITNTLSVRVMNDTISDEQQLSGKTLGYFSSMDVDDLSRLSSALQSDGIEYSSISYDDIFEMVDDLYNGYIDGILFNESFSGVITSDETYSMFVNRTTPVYSTTYYTDNEKNIEDSLDDVSVDSEPFTILISGNDSYGQFSENSRSDMNMLVTVNPKTATVLMTSIPRDYYVPIAELTDGYSDQELYDKLTHSGLYGVQTTEKTIENFLNTEINYYVRVNFSSLINLVDAIGGVDVYVEPGLAVDAFYADTTLGGVNEGWNHLNGKQALAFSRERHAYIDGDNQRVRNQQIVLKALISSLTKPTMLLNYPNFVSALSGAFETNMPAASISKLLKFEFGNFPKWQFESTSLIGYDGNDFCVSLGTYAYVLVPDELSIQTTHDKIEAVRQGGSSNDVEERNVEG